ncbi:MAG: hypothetical protein J0J15_01865, partial [Mesorhizobium sp.]|nr:hypothetical protein [Mesorhizobium sp.]
MLHYQGLAETADHLACGDLRAVVLTEALANGMRLGPMHGVPIAVKDLFDIAGVANTAGMPIRSRAIATQTATVIR